MGADAGRDEPPRDVQATARVWAMVTWACRVRYNPQAHLPSHGTARTDTGASGYLRPRAAACPADLAASLQSALVLGRLLDSVLDLEMRSPRDCRAVMFETALNAATASQATPHLDQGARSSERPRCGYPKNEFGVGPC